MKLRYSQTALIYSEKGDAIIVNICSIHDGSVMVELGLEAESRGSTTGSDGTGIASAMCW